MYRHILIPLENTPTDEAILAHIRGLARFTKAKLTLIHVADGYMARNQKYFGESEEMRRDRDYLARRESELKAEGFEVRTLLVCGNPAKEVLAAADSEHCDLIAMATHGHRFIGDLIRGSVASDVHHRARIPVLLVRA
ncbi:MAG: universal stress protein [Candidatus Zixiibacteriota bacterium]